MHTLPGHRVARAVRILQRLNRLVAPRVVAAFIRSICEGWATHARFQGVAACRFGCGVGRDSLSHIVKCPRALEWCERYAQLRRPPLGEEGLFFCMTDDSLDARRLLFVSTGPDAVLSARALSVYALYKLHNGA